MKHNFKYYKLKCLNKILIESAHHVYLSSVLSIFYMQEKQLAGHLNNSLMCNYKCVLLQQLNHFSLLECVWNSHVSPYSPILWSSGESRNFSPEMTSKVARLMPAYSLGCTSNPLRYLKKKLSVIYTIVKACIGYQMEQGLIHYLLFVVISKTIGIKNCG